MTRIISIFAVLLAAIASLATAHAAPAQRFFATMPFAETPFTDVTGIHPMSEVEAQTRKHFRFTYDAEGRVTRVAFMQGDEVVALNDSANYYFFAPQLVISYEEGIERRQFLDIHGNRITVAGDVFEEEYEFDARGYRKQLTFKGMDGQPVANSWDVVRYEWQLLDDGELIEKRYRFDGELAELRGGFPFYEVRFQFGPNGFLSLMRNFGLESELAMNSMNAAQDRLEYNAAGDLLSWNVLDVEGRYSRGNGPNVARGLLERDSRGYEIAEHYQDEHGNPIENAYGFAFTRKKNDRFGNLVEATNHELGGGALMVSSSRGYAGYRAIFDEAGRNRLVVEFFDANREPVVRAGRSYARIRSEFDAHDNEIATNYEDMDGALVNREDTGFARIERDYDERGRLVESRFLDAQGQLVDHSRAGYAVERRTYGDHGVAVMMVRLTADGEVHS